MRTENSAKHLYNRAGFGLSAMRRQENNTPTIKELLHNAKDFSPIEVIEKSTSEDKMPRLKENPRQAQARSREALMLLNTTWTEKLYSTEAVLREKMTLFWHDHFACRVRKAYIAQRQNNTLRQYALEKFGTLLMAVSKDAGMLQFLNNQQNKKDSPNENFAREVLELFTLGRGHYTEQDVKNAARAFTGWAFQADTGEYVFRTRVHDTGLKTFRGKTGNFTGEDILTLVLEDKQTARFITEKIWRYLVSTTITDEAILATLTDTFFKSDYDIEKLVTLIFSSDWFYEDRFVGNRIKSPVELLAGMLTQTGGRFENPESMVFIQRALGQILLLPPNVSGWPTGEEWIDSSSLMFRMSLPGILLKNATTDFEAKDDGDANNAANQVKAGKLAFNMNWQLLANQFMKSSSAESLAAIEDHLLARPVSTANRKSVSARTNKSENDIAFIQQAFTGFMSLPEYQMC